MVDAFCMHHSLLKNFFFGVRLRQITFGKLAASGNLMCMTSDTSLRQEVADLDSYISKKLQNDQRPASNTLWAATQYVYIKFNGIALYPTSQKLNTYF